MPSLTIAITAALVSAAALAASSSAVVRVSEVCDPGGKCNFTWLYSQLSRALDGSGRPLEPVRFVGALASLNLHLRDQLGDAGTCVQHWLNRPAGVSCEHDICCPPRDLAGLLPALELLKSDTKLSFTQIPHQQQAVHRTSAYQSAAFDILNVFAGAFLDYVRQLTVDSGLALVELKTFGVFYSKLRAVGAVRAIGLWAAGCFPGNATSDVGEVADECSRSGHLWRNAIGVALQNLVMSEVTRMRPDTEAAWRGYFAVADCVTQATLACERAGARRQQRDGFGVGGQQLAEAGLRGSDIALIVLIPMLLIALAVTAAVCVYQRRRRRYRQQRPERRVHGDAEGEEAKQQQQQQLQLQQQQQHQHQRQDAPDGQASDQLMTPECSAMVVRTTEEEEDQQLYPDEFDATFADEDSDEV